MTDEEIEEVYYYETFQGISSKFWEITIKYKETSYIIRSGRIGTEGTKTKKVWYSFDAARYQATLLRKAKEKEGYYLLKAKELGDKAMLNFKDTFDAFLIAYRWELICPYELYGLNPTYGWFPDDVYDNNLMDFFSKISKIIYTPEKESSHYDPMSELKDPNIVFDPNEKIDEAIDYVFTHPPFYDKVDIPFQTHSYPEDFQNRLKNWVTIYLNNLFLGKFYKHKKEFTLTSINKVVDATVKYILDQTYYFTLKDNGSIEKDVKYLDSVVLWYDKVRLPLLFSVIDTFYNLFPYSTTFKNIMYWLKPKIYFHYKNLKEQEVIETILKHEKSEQIPKGLCSKKLLIKVRKFTDGILSEFDETNLFDVGFRLFLHFAYYGLLDGTTPGIEQGVYSFNQLEKELDEFYQYKSMYFNNVRNEYP